ncbi:transmembrane GTPase [Grosmannia clavigera kw1407]|uniref:Transmembrane GTPase n=1 Tax=Grosmannia clavigera (strain kw1407 / UAMH 11150) TaxID=655863 RepID=F0XHK1_GROCL|nr:transmembrane GTPase [Grosmannia clavigera kw1407]EFX03120.1 transmembrane GTPase [Grosmannia clavigera kw1407]
MSRPSTDKGKSPNKRSVIVGEPSANVTDDDDVGHPQPSQPAYMTVGTGSTSKHAAHLQSLLDTDSGYGGSSTGSDGFPPAMPPSLAWGSASHEDRQLHPTGPSASHVAPEAERRLQAGAIHQLWYNQHRVALGKSITQAVELLKGLQTMNTSWPAHYPSVQKLGVAAFPDTALSGQPPVRPGFQRALTTVADFIDSSSGGRPNRAPMLRRSATVLDDPVDAESSKAAESRVSTTEPRLVTPQIAQEFSVLKLDLKLGGLHQAGLVHSLEKGSVASLLDEKIRSSIKHLLALRERIEDTSSKVLVTGDLNAGKSTFCNALLRRKILPEDQQPCTSIFCEVLDAGANSGVEEVHAVHMNAVYNRNDESTYDVFSLLELEKIVTDNSTYMQCKVYVKDVRTIDESLLNNGIVDIALIDAPGLNSDTTKTTAVFARQEEIDVVVFVVSATNHFTLTATEFIRAAAAEKAYFFFVVNGFDVIRDRGRCQKMILDQVSNLSPQTHKEASELVHFVSSNAIPIPPGPPGGAGGSGTGSSSGGGGGDPDGDPTGKGKGKEKLRDFEEMEQSLRRFVLEKRARSKLAPAKNYLLNILNDVNALANVNAEVAQSELARVEEELREIEPLLETNKKAKAEIASETEYVIEQTCTDVYDQSRAAIGFAIGHAGDENLGVPYPGILSAFQYAEQVKQEMLSQISASVAECEESARFKTAGGVNSLKQLGIMHLGNDYVDLNFRPEFMFRRRRDELARQIDIPTEFLDFVDLSTLLQRQEKMAGTGMALTVATALGSRMIGAHGWMDHAFSAVKLVGSSHTRRLLVPAFVLAVVAAAGYILVQIPQSLPHRLSLKIASRLAAIDYVHNNSNRIAGTVRKVLRVPADAIRDGLNRSVEQLGNRKDETLKTRGESQVALKYFSNLVTDSSRHRATVGALDLEAPPPGAH